MDSVTRQCSFAGENSSSNSVTTEVTTYLTKKDRQVQTEKHMPCNEEFISIQACTARSICIFLWHYGLVLEYILYTLRHIDISIPFLCSQSFQRVSRELLTGFTERVCLVPRALRIRAAQSHNIDDDLDIIFDQVSDLEWRTQSITERLGEEGELPDSCECCSMKDVATQAELHRSVLDLILAISLIVLTAIVLITCEQF
jgi:hypothetical protein